MTEPRTTAVVGCMERLFVYRECKSAEGSWMTYAIEEVSSEASAIGRTVQAALHDSWPDVHPSWETLVRTPSRPPGRPVTESLWRDRRMPAFGWLTRQSRSARGF